MANHNLDNTKTIGSLIDSFKEFGDKPALTFFQQNSEKIYSYGTLYDDIVRLSFGLKDIGITAGSRVVLLSANCYQWIASALASILIGAIVVPVDVQTEDEVLEYIVKDSGSCFVFTTQDQIKRLSSLREVKSNIIVFDVPQEETDFISWSCLLKDRESFLPSLSADDIAVLFYTSGTTGLPKGVPLKHRHILFQVKAINNAGIIKGDDRMLLPLPLHHVYPFVMGLLVPLSLGIGLYFPRSLTGTQIVKALDKAKITVLIGVPRLYQVLWDGVNQQVSSKGLFVRGIIKLLLGVSRIARYLHIFPGKRLLFFIHKNIGSHLRLLACGGAPLAPGLQQVLEDLGWNIIIGYGLTETAPLLTLNLSEYMRKGSVGKIIEGVQLKIDKSKPGLPGEILAKGPGVFEGYWNKPEETKKSFTQDNWFKTGDTGYLKSGYLYLSGRVSTLIITSSGKNIQPDALEAIFNRKESIKEIGIFQKNDKLVGVIVADNEQFVRDAVNQVQKNLASYQRLYDFIVTKESLPRTRLGKIRRYLLPVIYQRIQQTQSRENIFSAGAIAIHEMSDTDRNLLQDPLAFQVWQVLVEKYKGLRLTPDANFQIDLGVDSMQWINLSLELQEKTGIELEDRDIIDIDCVRDLLELLVNKEKKSDKKIEVKNVFEQPQSLISHSQTKWITSHSSGQKVLSFFLYALIFLLMKSLFRVKSKGLGKLDAKQQYLFISNHVSYLDPFVMAVSLGYRRLRSIYWAGGTDVAFTNNFTRFFSRLAQIVPIERKTKASLSLAFILSVLKKGKSLILFPEGRRSPSGELLEFAPGLSLILKNNPEIEVVPVVISGSFSAWPVQRFFPRPHSIKVYFNQPLLLKDIKDKSGGELSSQEITKILFEYLQKLKTDIEAQDAS